LIFPTKVQGAGAAEEIAAGIRYFNKRSDVNVIIIGRGGGSIEDLWAFNEEVVARAIYASELPLISAVGHEVDFTISDFVADLRAPTPSAAAEMVSGARGDLCATVDSLKGRLCQAMRRIVERRRLSLERLSHNKAFMIAPNKIRELQQRFDESSMLMIQAMRQFERKLRHRERIFASRLRSLDLRRVINHKNETLARCRQGLISHMKAFIHVERSAFELAAGKMNALSPLAILNRGFALCRDEQGAIVKNANDVSCGDKVRVTLSAGELKCTVEEKNP
jgi:exodeoxyribonuclease VII large subunit